MFENLNESANQKEMHTIKELELDNFSVPPFELLLESPPPHKI